MYKARFKDNNIHIIGDHSIDGKENTLLDFQWGSDNTFYIIIDNIKYQQDFRKFAVVEVNEDGQEYNDELDYK